MDYSKFSDENFDAKKWVNTALASAKDDNIDQHAISLVMKLQMFIQEVNNVIDDTCQQVVTSFPRVIKELEVITQEASLLKDQMKFVKNEIEKVERNTAHSMHTIYKLDSVKNRMKLASDALREADNWTTLISDADEVVDSNDITEIANKIVKMKISLNTLSDVVDYEERCNYLERLKDKFEAVASSQIISTLSLKSNLELKFFVNIFTQVDRLDHLHKYYISFYKQKMIESWSGSLEENRSENIVDCISTFYNNVALSWESQLKNCIQIFSDPFIISCDLITEAFQSLNPIEQNFFEDYFEQEKDQPIIVNLIFLQKIINNSHNHYDTLIESYLINDQEFNHYVEMLRTFYFPFREYLSKYLQSEKDYLLENLRNMRLSNRDIDESVNLMASSVSRIFFMIIESIDRCFELFNGNNLYSCIAVLIEFLKEYIIELKRLNINISERLRTNIQNSVDVFEWSAFQNCLRIVQTCGDVFNQLEKLDKTIVIKSNEIINKYNYSLKNKNYKNLKISDLQLILFEPNEDIKNLIKLVDNIEQKDFKVLKYARDDLSELCRSVNKFSYDIVFGPLQLLLSQIPNLEVWKSEVSGSAISKLPIYSIAPHEYITKVAQYLLTLPQQLDSFTLGSDTQLRSAMQYGRLPYISDDVILPNHLADIWLESVTSGLMNVYVDEILKISKLTESGANQLLVDIEYLMNVLDDVGLKPSESICSLSVLLKENVDTYQIICINHSQRLSSAIAKIRGIHLMAT